MAIMQRRGEPVRRRDISILLEATNVRCGRYHPKRLRTRLVAYLRAADNVSRLLPIWLRGMHQPAVSL